VPLDDSPLGGEQHAVLPRSLGSLNHVLHTPINCPTSVVVGAAPCVSPGRTAETLSARTSTRLSTGVDKPDAAWSAQDRSTIRSRAKTSLISWPGTIAGRLSRALAGPVALPGRTCAPVAHVPHNVLHRQRPLARASTPERPRRIREAHISAQQPPASQAPRLPCPHVDARWSRGAQEPSRQGPGASVRLIDRIRSRDAFRRLTHDGTRIRRSALWCTWCPDPSTTTTSVAFALGRALGPAVRRNRLRRRLRAILREVEPTMPGGLLMIGATPAAIELTFGELRRQLEQLLSKAFATVPAEAGSRG
jgi:ribonuclease P protein component